MNTDSEKPVLDYATPDPAPKQIVVNADVMAWLAGFCGSPLFGTLLADRPGQFVGWIAAAPLAWLARKTVLRAKPELLMVPRREFYFGLATTLFVVGYLFVSFDLKTCVHGRQVAFGPVEIAYSLNGGPCGRSEAAVYSHIGGSWFFVIRAR